MDQLEEAYARLSYEVRLYKSQLSLLQKEIEKITLTTMDLNNAVRTVESVNTGEALIPIGGGSFISGETKSTNVLLSVGSGYLIETEKDVALEKLKRRGEMTKGALDQLSKEFTKISAKLDATSKQIKEVERNIMISRRTNDAARDDYV